MTIDKTNPTSIHAAGEEGRKRSMLADEMDKTTKSHAIMTDT